jgi:hypothetical protein
MPLSNAELAIFENPILAPADDDSARDQEIISVIERVAVIGDLGQLQAADRVRYYARLCESLKLNPLTRPCEYVSLQGKLTL